MHEVKSVIAAKYLSERLEKMRYRYKTMFKLKDYV